MGLNDYLTEKRVNILLNALVFGSMAALGALPTLLSGQPIPVETIVLLAIAAFLGGFVGYVNSKWTEFETGAHGMTQKPRKGVKVGF